MLQKYVADSYTEMINGVLHTTTKIWKNSPSKPVEGRSHWDDPNLVFCEQVEGEDWSSEAQSAIETYCPEWLEEEEE